MTFGLRRAKVLGLLFVQLVSKISNLCGPDPPTSQTDGQTDGRTDGRTTCNLNTALYTIVHRVVKSRTGREGREREKINKSKQSPTLKVLLLW